MNKPRPPRLILTKAALSWLVEHPDNDALNQGMIQAYGEITPLPIPYTAACDFEDVKAGMAQSFPNHTILRGNDIEFPVTYLPTLMMNREEF